MLPSKVIDLDTPAECLLHMMLSEILVVLVGPTFVPTIHASLLFGLLGVCSLVISLSTKVSSVYLFPHDVFIYLMMSFFMKMSSLLKPFIPMPVPFSKRKFFSFQHQTLMRMHKIMMNL
jgi:hypothetical protein